MIYYQQMFRILSLYTSILKVAKIFAQVKGVAKWKSLSPNLRDYCACTSLQTAQFRAKFSLEVSSPRFIWEINTSFSILIH